jgi:hypothetical protein
MGERVKSDYRPAVVKHEDNMRKTRRTQPEDTLKHDFDRTARQARAFDG